MAVRKSKHYHLISHVVFQHGQPIYGPIHVLEKYLLGKKHQVSRVLLPLTFEGNYSIHHQGKTTKTTKSFQNVIKKYLFELYFVFAYIARHVGIKETTVIAVDPLNCFPAVLLKPFLGYRLIYYTADYTTKRFPSNMLNSIYFLLDTICLWVCDENWCVSSRIVSLREKQGHRKKVKFLPNTPLFEFPPVAQEKKHVHKLIYVGRMDDQMKLPLLLNVIRTLHTKNKKFQLTLIGGGELEKDIVSFIKKEKASKYISYLGPQPNEKVIENIRTHGIGIALYTGGNDWNNFGDSMKIREYQYFGLPVITTTVPSNCEEIQSFKSGIVLEKNDITEFNVITALQTIVKKYSEFSSHTVINANARLKERMLDDILVTN